MRRLALSLVLAGCGGSSAAHRDEAAEKPAISPALQRCYEVTELPRLAQAWGDNNATVAAFLSFENEVGGCEPLLVPSDRPAAEAEVLRAGLALQRLQMHRLAAQAYFSDQQMPETCSTLQRALLLSDSMRARFALVRTMSDETLPDSMQGLGAKVADEANRLAGFFVFAHETHCTGSGSGE